MKDQRRDITFRMNESVAALLKRVADSESAKRKQSVSRSDVVSEAVQAYAARKKVN